MKHRLSFHALEILYASIAEFRSTQETAGIAKVLAFHNQLDRMVLERNAAHFIDINLHGGEFVIKYDVSMLEKVLKRVIDERQERILHEEFIRRGASSTCMLELFGLKKHQVNSLRKFVGEVEDDAVKFGRPNLDRLDDVVDAYIAIDTEKPHLSLPEKILELQNRLDLPIAAIWNLLQQAYAANGGEVVPAKNIAELR